ncbi:ShlB/FhaC/HecB family hemolysin secretion/activation protein [Dyella monticola]|uniref:ShlB/FhaC/HecB family hemolysin secretion/activation protein n=1 Tax=Dyella monticola TaxID=1927958 RepID=UPI001313DAF8|nr:ShlB/FhaC/HecB family hemolysin secretion/activation protein [Dyella monticola]
MHGRNRSNRAQHALRMVLLTTTPVWAQTAPLQVNPLSQQAQDLQKQQQAPRVSAGSLQPSVTSWRVSTLPSEKPCFVVQKLVLEGPHVASFHFAQRYLNRYAGRCVGEQGLRQIVARVSDRILAEGYITTEVKLPQQNLSSGTLKLVVIPGILQGFKLAPDSAPLDWRSAFPLRPGDVLNLRALEQGLEQIKQIASQDVHMNIEPGDQPGTSVVVLTAARTKPWRVTVGANNEGFKSTGRDQGSISLAIDQPLRMNDALTLSVSHSLPLSNDEVGSRNWSLDERIPWGWWNVDAYASSYGFFQQLLGGTQTFRSSGTAQTFGIRVSRVVHRTKNGRTTVQASIDGREADNYIDGTAIAIQHRHTRSVSLGIAQRQYMGAAQLDASITYQHGVPWFNGQWDPSTPNAQIPRFDYQLMLSDVALQWPLHWGTQTLSLSSALHWQYSPDRLYAEDYIGIGGPFTVRGFEGDDVLSAEDGYYSRNQLTLPLSRSGVSLYTGWDYGRVWGPDFAYPRGHVVSGVFVGTQGAVTSHIQWDVSLGWPLIAPAWLPTSEALVKASVQVSF